MLAMFVSNAMGGSQRKSFSSSHIHAKDSSLDQSGMSLFNLSRQEIYRLRNDFHSNAIFIGNISHGGTRHRALLFKFLADAISLPSKLVRASGQETNIVDGEYDLFVHYFNLVFKLDSTRTFIVDLLHRPGSLYDEQCPQAIGYKQLCLPINSLEEYPFGGISDLHSSSNDIPISTATTTTSIVTLSATTTTSSLKGSSTDRIFRWIAPRDFSTEKLKKLEVIGKGGFGSVWRCSLAGFTCAVKLFYTEVLDAKNRIRMEREVRLLQKLEHPNIVSYLGHEKHCNQVYLFMEYIPCSLYRMIKEVSSSLSTRHRFSSFEIIVSAVGMLRALVYMHGLPDKVIHRDLKVSFNNRFGRFSIVLRSILSYKKMTCMCNLFGILIAMNRVRMFLWSEMRMVSLAR